MSDAEIQKTVKSDLPVGASGSPEGLNCAAVERILEDVRDKTAIADRIDEISRRFLGKPYIEAPLGGGVDQVEVFRATLDGFDCVTYVETVLAMAMSRTPGEFIEYLRALRYAEGHVDWLHRNHYMVDWARNNESCGFVANVTAGADAIETTRRLGLVSGLPQKEVTFWYYPRERVAELSHRGASGDLVFFVSEKDTLDVFHTGILLKRDGEIVMRHATRTAGAVIEQRLAEFLSANQTPGMILLRPSCRR